MRKKQVKSRRPVPAPSQTIPVMRDVDMMQSDINSILITLNVIRQRVHNLEVQFREMASNQGMMQETVMKEMGDLQTAVKGLNSTAEALNNTLKPEMN